jgi:hypothetical protein
MYNFRQPSKPKNSKSWKTVGVILAKVWVRNAGSLHSRGKIMNRKLRTSLVTIAALVPVMNIVCQAASPAPATRHVRDVVANGQAKSVGRLPATEPMRLVLVLPHRNQPALDNLLKELYDPSSRLTASS